MRQPGRSKKRTPFKLELARQHIGAHIGAAPYVKHYRYGGYLVVDLNAGDGEAYPGSGSWVRGSTIGIVANIVSTHTAVPVRALAYESIYKTFRQLQQNLTTQLPNLGFIQHDSVSWRHSDTQGTLRIIQADSRTEQFELRPHEWLYAINDPNSMNGWCLNNDRFTSVIRKGHIATFMAAMGFNSKGIKRLPWTHRKEWAKHLAAMIAIHQTNPYLDLILTELIKDPDQWAYMVMTPCVWSARTVTTTKKAAAKFNLNVDVVSLKDNRHKFISICDRHIRTVEEQQ